MFDSLLICYNVDYKNKWIVFFCFLLIKDYKYKYMLKIVAYNILYVYYTKIYVDHT